MAYQPFKTEAVDIRTQFSCSLPSLRQIPFDINPESEISTATILQCRQGEFQQQVDPVVLFWNVGLTYPFKLTT
jgi:hypothetical protein